MQLSNCIFKTKSLVIEADQKDRTLMKNRRYDNKKSNQY